MKKGRQILDSTCLLLNVAAVDLVVVEVVVVVVVVVVNTTGFPSETNRSGKIMNEAKTE